MPDLVADGDLDDVRPQAPDDVERRLTTSLSTSVLAVLIALVIGGLILLMSGENPLTAYSAMVDGAFGSSFALGETLSRAAPLAIVGYGTAVALRAGLITIGAQGQVVAGAIGALLTAQFFENAPSAVAIPAAALGGALFGMAWVLIPALLRARFNVNEILSTLLFTEFAALLIEYLLNNPLKPPTAITPQSEPYPKNGILGLVVDGTRFHFGVFAAFVIGIAFVWWIRSDRGFSYDLYGENPSLAQSLGISGNRVIINSLLISGATAGLVGWMQAAGLLQRVYVQIASDIGFFGLVVAFLGGATAGGVLVAALLFGALQSGGLAMQSSEGIPASLSDIIQALLLLGFSIRYAPQIIRLTRGVMANFTLIGKRRA
ncbi:MAG: ABC transporter permease [Acidimicrobiia bacterium]|nr:ABC transporter permease [Acidimicrobiia bacterium]MYE74308.1 ABC transporter permease [Acidimicrobiia bacterium]MYJ62158.1 ABC transporter permease [Acidimicrobiia bacterium]